MAISPNDFSLWARLTGNKYPSTPAERAKKGPEVHNFIQNLDKEGMLGRKEPEQPKKEKNLAEKVATGALIAGGVAAAVAAGRDKRVQDVAQRAASATKTKIDDFLSNLGKARVVDVDIVNASGDVTPDPRQQQSNVAPQLTGTSAAGRLTSIGSNQVRDPELGLVTFDKGATPEQINNTLTSIKMDMRLDRKAREGNLTRKDERQFLKKELTRSGMTAKELLGNDTIEGYLDRMEKEGAFKPVEQYISSKLPTDDILYPDGVPQRKEPVVVVDRFTPAVEGKTFGTSGAISKLEDIGDAKLRARRTYGPMIDAIQQKNPGINVGSMGRSMLAKAEQDRDYDLAYMVARGQGKTDETATQIARATAGFPTDSPIGKPTPYREFLGEQRTSSIRKESIDNLLKLVEPGPQINLPESVQEPGALVQLAAGSTPSNKVPTMGATIGGSSLTDKHATKMAVDNALDAARANYEKTVSAIVEAGQTKGGSISTAAKAEQFLQKMRPTVVKELDKAIQEDLTKTTGLNPEDAANIAESVINPTTGERQFNTDQFGDLGTETKRDIKDLRSVPNIDPDTKQGTMKTAVGTAIRGRAPSYYEALPKTNTRELPGPFEETVPDRRTATRAGFGAALQKSIEEEGISPAKMPEGGSAGIGIYGEQPGYVSGPFSSTAKTKPTDAPGVRSPFKGVSDATLTKLKSDMKPGTKSFESVDKEQKGRASMDAARELRKIQTSGDPSTANERVAKFLDNLKKQQGG